MVEFALILPVFLLLVFAAVELGRAFLYVHLLTNASREGARTGCLPGNVEADVEDTVGSFLEGVGLDSGSWSTSIEVRDADGGIREGGLTDAEEGDKVSVALTYNFVVLIGSLIPNFQGTVPLSARCVFRHE